MEKDERKKKFRRRRFVIGERDKVRVKDMPRATVGVLPFFFPEALH